MRKGIVLYGPAVQLEKAWLWWVEEWVYGTSIGHYHELELEGKEFVEKVL